MEAEVAGAAAAGVAAVGAVEAAHILASIHRQSITHLRQRIIIPLRLTIRGLDTTHHRLPTIRRSHILTDMFRKDHNPPPMDIRVTARPRARTPTIVARQTHPSHAPVERRRFSRLVDPVPTVRHTVSGPSQRRSKPTTGR
jgi:hypothetical protein